MRASESVERERREAELTDLDISLEQASARLRARAAPDGWRKEGLKCKFCRSFVPSVVTNHWCAKMTASLVNYLNISLEQAHSLSLPAMLALVDARERDFE
jgi:hypothetical protein